MIFTDKIKLGLYGFGNVAKGVLFAAKESGDLAVTSVFTKRNPNEVSLPFKDINVYSKDELLNHKNDIDVLVMCGGSFKDLPKETPYAARYFNTVDSFDTHSKIKEHFENTDRAAKSGKKTAIISVGWDPGLFSLFRAYSKSVLNNAKTYTFWGRGVSQGHTEALKKTDGVLYAVQYTVPKESAKNAVKSGAAEKLLPREMHERVCYIVPKDGADKEKIEKEIKDMKNYFDEYDTKVYYISEEEFFKNHTKMMHGGTVFSSGKTGECLKNRETAEFSLKLDSNPEFTGCVLASYARAASRLSKEGFFGCKTVFDVAPSYLFENTDYLDDNIL